MKWQGLIQTDAELMKCINPRPAGFRNLGCSILLAAIADYRKPAKESDYKDAAALLYPRKKEYKKHYDWVASLIEAGNSHWLREQLDRNRRRWDKERSLRKYPIKPTMGRPRKRAVAA